MTSDRQRRLAALSRELDNRLHVASIRVSNAECQLHEHLTSTTVYPPSVEAAYRAEAVAAQDALDAIRAERAAALAALDRHTAILPDGAMLLVLTRDRGEYIVERKDCPESPQDGTWYRFGDPDTPMAFDEAIGVDDYGQAQEFNRIYTAEEVDDLLDQLGVPDQSTTRDGGR